MPSSHTSLAGAGEVKCDGILGFVDNSRETWLSAALCNYYLNVGQGATKE